MVDLAGCRMELKHSLSLPDRANLLPNVLLIHGEDSGKN